MGYSIYFDRNLQFLSKVIIIKAMVLLSQEYVILADFDYPA